MGAVMNSCSHYWDFSVQPGPPKLMMRVTGAPIQDSLGAKCSHLQPGEEFAVVKLETLKEFDILRWRYPPDMTGIPGQQRSYSGARASATKAGRAPPMDWPASYRFMVPRRSWRVTIVSQDSEGGTACETCVLQMAASPQERTARNVELDLIDAKDACSYAHRFNLHQMHSCDPSATAAEAADMPGIRVAAPIACEVLGSGLQGLIVAGDHCTVTPYASTDVQKFVFDGSEDYHELPQAYFHYSAFASGGREFVCDIQGFEEDDGNFTLIDPVMLRAARATVTDLLATVMPKPAAGSAEPKTGPSVERFDALHPRCGQMCKVFDPQRRGATMKNACGPGGIMSVACGLGA